MQAAFLRKTEPRRCATRKKRPATAGAAVNKGSRDLSAL
jgi:hypothetical protein